MAQRAGQGRSRLVALLAAGVVLLAAGAALLLTPLHYGTAPTCGTALWSATAPPGSHAAWSSTCAGLRVTRQEYGSLVLLLGALGVAGGATHLARTRPAPGRRVT